MHLKNSDFFNKMIDLLSEIQIKKLNLINELL
jgi:hypothetical protein